VVRRYVSENQTALEISEECGIGKSTVLRVLKAAEVPMRRQGEKRL
jgi:DNA-directed RNA polymerase specialized sigma subunit